MTVEQSDPLYCYIAGGRGGDAPQLCVGATDFGMLFY